MLQIQVDESLEKLKALYLEALISGRAYTASDAVTRALAAGLSPSQVYLQILMAGQREIGALWEAQKVSIAQEHLATQITLHEMTRLRTVARPKSSLGAHAVIATVDGDAHFLGGRVVADLLYMDGWEVDYLGTNTPSADLVKFAGERGADLVGLSVTMPEGLSEVQEIVAQLKTFAKPPKIMVGGPAVNGDPHAFQRLGVDGLGQDGLRAVQEARRICGLSGSQASLSQYLKGLGERILGNRKSRKFSQQELAHRAGLDRAYISSVENGKQNLTIGAIFKLSEALEVTLEDLLVGKRN